jgi:hypothetical protein
MVPPAADVTGGAGAARLEPGDPLGDEAGGIDDPVCAVCVQQDRERALPGQGIGTDERERDEDAVVAGSEDGLHRVSLEAVVAARCAQRQLLQSGRGWVVAVRAADGGPARKVQENTSPQRVGAQLAPKRVVVGLAHGRPGRQRHRDRRAAPWDPREPVGPGREHVHVERVQRRAHPAESLIGLRQYGLRGSQVGTVERGADDPTERRALLREHVEIDAVRGDPEHRVGQREERPPRRRPRGQIPDRGHEIRGVRLDPGAEDPERDAAGAVDLDEGKQPIILPDCRRTEHGDVRADLLPEAMAQNPNVPVLILRRSVDGAVWKLDVVDGPAIRAPHVGIPAIPLEGAVDITTALHVADAQRGVLRAACGHPVEDEAPVR